MTTPQAPGGATDCGVPGRMFADLLDLVRRVKADPAAYPEAEALFESASKPDRRRLANMLGGDARYSAIIALIEQFVPEGHRVARLAARHKIQAIRDDLAGPGATFSERLLADRAATCWFWVHSLENNLATVWAKQSLAQNERLMRQVSQAHRNLVMTLKALAAVRRVSPSSVRVDVGGVRVEGNTVTVSAGAAPADPPGDLMTVLGGRVSPRN